jgi:hypothetical protein
LRHAFYTGAGYGDTDKISDEDQKRWTAYDPTEEGFKRISEVLHEKEQSTAKSIQAKRWSGFSERILKHIETYVIPQYGDEGEEPALEYSLDDCVKQAQRYLARHGKSSREGEEGRDILKAAHWLQKAYDRLPEEKK